MQRNMDIWGNWYFFFIIFPATLLLIPFNEQVSTYIDQYIVFLLPAIIFVLLAKQSFKEVFKLRKINFKTFWLSIAALIVSYPTVYFVGAIAEIVWGTNTLLNEAIEMSPTLILSLIIFAITPAICEEAAFRGVLLNIRSKYSIHELAILNGILFGLFHVVFSQVIYTITLGIVFAYFTIITRSIWPAVIMHFVNNGFQVVLSKIYEAQETTSATTTSTEVVYTVPELAGWFVAMVIGLFFLVLIIKKLIKVNNYSEAKRLSEAEEVENTKTNGKLAAGLLGIFLGTIGAHKFYLGQTGWGIVYLLFSWTLIPSIVGIIEGIVYLTMNKENFDRKYVTQAKVLEMLPIVLAVIIILSQSLAISFLL